jgi:4-hydroxy-2-oxoheptanedioate aldolase
MKNLKKRLLEGETLLGTFNNLGNPVVSEMTGQAGFDFVILDLEHGTGSEQDILFQIQAMNTGPAAAFVRVESYERQRVHHVLDSGAEGIMFPRLQCVDEVKDAIRSLWYPPHGVRGVAKMVRASGFGQHFESYYRDQKQNITGIIQVETREILDCLEEVAALEGVDVLFVGPMDLSMALGIFGEFDHPLFVEALKKTASAAGKAGKVCGILLPTIDRLPEWYHMGYRFFTGGGDLGFIKSGAQSTIGSMKKLLQALPAENTPVNRKL